MLVRFLPTPSSRINPSTQVAKLAGRLGVPAFELVLARSLVLVSVSAAMLARQQGGAARWPWRSPRRALLLLRGLCGLGAVSSLYLAVQWLPLSDTAVLGFLAPVFVAGGAPLVLGEPTGRGVLLALPLCAAGVLLVAQPTLLFGSGAQALSAVGVAFGVAQVRRWRGWHLRGIAPPWERRRAWAVGTGAWSPPGAARPRAAQPTPLAPPPPTRRPSSPRAPSSAYAR